MISRKGLIGWAAGTLAAGLVSLGLGWLSGGSLGVLPSILLGVLGSLGGLLLGEKLHDR